MRVSYKQLVDEHDEIADMADRLLGDMSHTPADALASRLTDFARLVKAHIQHECSALAQVEPTRLNARWDAAWGEGMPRFRKLQADWVMYLCTWDERTIAARRDDFVHATGSMLARLRERMAAENEALYSIALQTSAIAMA